MPPAKQVIPKVEIQLSSAELPRTEHTEQLEAGPAASKAPSRLQQWLDRQGIPLNTGRQKKGTRRPKDDTSDKSPDSRSSITASNVTTQELEQCYNWSFYPHRDDVPARETPSCRILLSKVASLFEPDKGKDSKPQQASSHAFSLPLEWLTPEAITDDEAFWRQTLLAYLNIHDHNHDHVKFRRQKDIENAKFPEPNIFNMRNEKLEGGGIAWNLTNILASPTFSLQENHPGPRSELEVERLYGSSLSGFFNVPECETTSNVQLSFREELLCFGSHPKPDFMARIKPGVIPVKGLNYDLYPVFTLGETKKKRNLQQSKKTKKQDSTLLRVPSGADTDGGLDIRLNSSNRGAKLPMAAQLAFSAYPSLIIIIASLIMEWQSSPPTPKGRKPKIEDYQIPEHAVIYGIGYASNGLLIYAFFPYVRKWNKQNFPSEWGFMSVLVCSDFSSVFKNHDVKHRFKLVKVLLMLQQHATRLKDKIKAVEKWPKEFLD